LRSRANAVGFAAGDLLLIGFSDEYIHHDEPLSEFFASDCLLHTDSKRQQIIEHIQSWIWQRRHPGGIPVANTKG
jgi:hypothetical protein